jgi:hypothetical protein
MEVPEEETFFSLDLVVVKWTVRADGGTSRELNGNHLCSQVGKNFCTEAPFFVTEVEDPISGQSAGCLVDTLLSVHAVSSVPLHRE